MVFHWWMMVTECFTLWWLVPISGSVKNLSVEHCMFIFSFSSPVRVLLAAKITDAIPSSAWNSAGVPALKQIELYVHNRNVTTHQRKLYLYNLVSAFNFTHFIYFLHEVTICCRFNLCLHVLCRTHSPCFMP